MLLKAGGILYSSKYSWSIELQNISLDTQGVHCLITFGMEIFAQGSWNFELVKIYLIIELQIVLLGMLGRHCLIFFTIQNSCSRHLEFWLFLILQIIWIVDCCVRHTWIKEVGFLTLSKAVLFVMENSCSNQVGF